MATGQGDTMQSHLAQASATVVGGGFVWGFSPQQWEAAATVLYFAVMTAYTLWKWRREAKAKNGP